MKKRFVFTATLAASVLLLVPVAGQALELTVDAGDTNRENTPVRVLLKLPASQAAAKTAILSSPGEQRLVGQLTAPGLLAPPVKAGAGVVVRELHFILPKLRAGRTIKYSVLVGGAVPKTDSFKWYDKPDQYSTLMFGRRPVLVYMYSPLDESTRAAREATYKVYHHVYDPEGKRIVTKGPGGRYTHHRGLFYGFNRITYDGNKKADVWHCKGDAYQSHEGFLAKEEGPVLGRHCVAVAWHGVGKEVFAKEERELTVYNVPGGTLIEFASRLKSAGPKIKLDGDPQHAGFHFRASNEVAAKTFRQTYYLRPDGKGKMGETRNWNPKTKQGPKNLPWNAMSFVLGGQRYTCCYLDNPANPKEARYSERDYGRFGSYFEYELNPTNKLDIDYRIWLQDGEMTVDQAAALSADFVKPVKVSVK